MSGCPVKISVIIPIYNVEKYLYSSLGSCVKQTLNDVEFICVNDGSTDGSLEIVKEFAERDHRFVVIDKPNGGVSSARNAGLEAAQGEYIMFLDADDYFEPTACERVWIEKLEAPTDIVIFSSNVFPTIPKPIDWYYYVLTAPTRRYWEFTPKVLFGEPSTRPFIWHQAFRKEILDEHNIRFNEEIHQGEDMIFLLQLYPHAKYFCFIQDHLINYRWYRKGSAMDTFNDGNMDKRVEEHLVVSEIICEYWKEMGWLEEYGVSFLEWLLIFIVRDIQKPDTKNPSKHIKQLKTIIQKYNLSRYAEKVSPHIRSLAKIVK